MHCHYVPSKVVVKRTSAIEIEKFIFTMPRLYHTKSRTGCARCRARRVKCNEARPKCASCARHSVECIYDRGAVQSASPSTQPTLPTPPTPPSSAADAIFDEGRARRYRELRLLHLFTSEVCHTFPGSFLPEVLSTWRDDVPVMAMDYEPLLNAIMALAILYARYTDKRGILRADELRTYSALYLETALPLHREELGMLDESTADAASFTSAVLTFYTFASLRERELDGPYVVPLEWIQMCRGLAKVFTVAQTLVVGNPNAKVNTIAEGYNGWLQPGQIFTEANRTRFECLTRFDGDEADREAHDQAASYVGALQRAKEAGDADAVFCRKVMVFCVMFPERFVESLKRGEARALLVLAYYFGVAASCAHWWWIWHSPQREVAAIARVLGDAWAQDMAWPLERANIK